MRALRKGHQERGRALAAIAAWIVLLVFTRVASGEAPKALDVTVLTPPPLSSAASTVPVLAPPSPDLARFLGRPVARAFAVLDDETWADVRLPQVQAIKPGDTLTATALRRAVSEALGTGSFADARAVVEAGGTEGVSVALHLVPRKLIQNIRADLHGASLDSEELLREADLVEGGEIVARNLPRQRNKIEAWLARRGFPSPIVTITTRPTDIASRVIVVLDVAPGVPRLIARRTFYVVHGDAKDLVVATDGYAVRAGDRTDETLLTAADGQLELKLRALGYHRAEVSHDVVLFQGLVTARVRIDAGPLFEARFEGNDHYDKDALAGALGLDEEADRSQGHLVSKVRDFYARRGYLDVEVSLELRGVPDGTSAAAPQRGQHLNDKVQFLVFHIVEHARVVVASRAYPCLKEEDVRRLRDGGPRSASAIGSEIDSYLEEELPGGDLFRAPRASGLDRTIAPSGTSRPTPTDLDPNGVYVSETYDRAVMHVQELYRSEGFLHAQAGPAQIVRRACDRRSPPGTCIPKPLPVAPADVCTYDVEGLPLPVPPLDASATCTPDPVRGIECEPTVSLRIPIKLGPRTMVYDVAFWGARAISQAKLQDEAKVPLGDAVNTLKLDEARRRVLDAYKEEGYAYADVKYEIEASADHTRARVRFEISEGEQVIVRDIVVRGNDHTNTGAILRRVALGVGKPYRASLVRKTQERIATLNAFSSIAVAMEDPYVPQKNKIVVINVVELVPQHVEVLPGFSTGEGFRFAFEYGHNNLAGSAISLTIRLQLSYLPPPLILDPVAKTNFSSLELGNSIGKRVTMSLAFPEIGLGPLVRAVLDGIAVHDLQRDFVLTKLAAIPSVNYRPIRDLQITASQSVEYNDVRIFQSGTITQYLQSLIASNNSLPTDLIRYLNVPDGPSIAVAQRLVVTWDRRDNAPNASRGTYFVTAIEHVDAYPQVDEGTTLNPAAQSHFLKLTQTFAGYIPLPKGLRIASSLKVGTNVQLTPTSETYPDRLFFMGGVESMRGWLSNSFLPQDDVDRVFATRNQPDTITQLDPKAPPRPFARGPNGTVFNRPVVDVPNPTKFTPNSRPVRGGNLMFNPRVELRIPIRGPFETVAFGDFGNLWADPMYPFDRGKFPMRAAAGAGLRVQTPVGPLALDYGVNLTREPYEDFGAFSFAIGLF